MKKKKKKLRKNPIRLSACEKNWNMKMNVPIKIIKATPEDIEMLKKSGALKEY